MEVKTRFGFTWVAMNAEGQLFVGAQFDEWGDAYEALVNEMERRDNEGENLATYKFRTVVQQG